MNSEILIIIMSYSYKVNIMFIIIIRFILTEGLLAYKRKMHSFRNEPAVTGIDLKRSMAGLELEDEVR